MRFGDFILLILLLCTLGFGLYVLWLYLPSETVSLKPVYVPADTVSVPPSQVQFYPDMRYPDRNITYHIGDACTEAKRQDIQEAFATLSQLTILQFTQADPGEIDILCSDIAPAADQKNHFVAGEGGPTTIINASRYYVILGGKVSLYRSETCDKPQVAIHEILHALGFDHNQNPNSIMYPITNCNQQVDQYIIDTIDNLYKADSLSDLTITDVQGSKSGRYLNFDITVANYGLRDADAVNLSVSADGRFVKEFDLRNIALGTRKVFTVQNLKIPSDTQDITFYVYTTDGTSELSTKNNRADLSVRG